MLLFQRYLPFALNGKSLHILQYVQVLLLVEIRFGNKLLTVRVLEMKDSTKKEDAAKMYEIIKETRIEADGEA